MAAGWVLFPADDRADGSLDAGGARWRVGHCLGGQPRLMDVPVPPAAAATQVAATVADVMAGAGRRGEDVVVALPSGRCLCASVRLNGLPRRRRRQAMLYRLEEALPLAAEDVAADFITHEHDALGVSTEASPLAALLEALRDRHVPVAAVCPAAMLALQALLRGSSARDFDCLLWQEGDAVELFHVVGAKPRTWQTLPAPSRVPTTALAALAAMAAVNGNKGPDGEKGGDGSSPAVLRVAVVGGDRRLAERVAALSGVEVAALPGDAGASLAGLAVAEAGRLLGGTAAAPVDLRPGGLGGASRSLARPLRRPLTVAAAAAVLLWAVAVGGTLWRAERYANLASRYEGDKVAAFRRALPGQPVPEGIEARLRSTERRLRDGGLAGSGAAAPNPSSGTSPASERDAPGARGARDAAAGSALLTLREALSRLPGDVRYRVTELQLDGPELTLRGEVQTHADADRIASALRAPANPAAPGGFVVEEPQSRTSVAGRGQVIEFTLRATWSRAAPAAVARAKGGEP